MNTTKEIDLPWLIQTSSKTETHTKLLTTLKKFALDNDLKNMKEEVLKQKNKYQRDLQQ